jgi:hypothetical protein
LDPNAALATILAWAHEIDNEGENSYDAWDIAELVIALDQWLRQGGFLPEPWDVRAKSVEDGGWL